MTSDSPWLVVADAVTYAKSSRTEITAALVSGALRGYQATAGGKWRINRADLDAWVRGEDPPAINPTFTRQSA